MSNLNNVDVIILIVIGISALIALSRGLVKEVLSIVGWVLGVIAIIYFLPILNPITSQYVSSGFMSGVVTALFILIAFLVIWILITGNMVGKVRKSKLGSVDRILGLFFGIARAFLLVILAYILIGWVVPKEKQSKALTESKYFQIAGSFAEPIEKLIPEKTLEEIRKKTGEITSEEDKKKEEEGIKSNKPKTEADLLFEKLAQPKIKKKSEDVKKGAKDSLKKAVKKLEKEEPKKQDDKDVKTPEPQKPDVDVNATYNAEERSDLDKLIEEVHQ